MEVTSAALGKLTVKVAAHAGKRSALVADVHNIFAIGIVFDDVNDTTAFRRPLNSDRRFGLYAKSGNRQTDAHAGQRVGSYQQR